MLVGNAYGSDGLGVYSVGLSVYMIGSVVSTLGVHSSLLKHVPALTADPESRSRCISAGLYLGLGLGLTVACLVWLGAPAVAAARVWSGEEAEQAGHAPSAWRRRAEQ